MNKKMFVCAFSFFSMTSFCAEEFSVKKIKMFRECQIKTQGVLEKIEALSESLKKKQDSLEKTEMLNELLNKGEYSLEKIAVLSESLSKEQDSLKQIEMFKKRQKRQENEPNLFIFQGQGQNQLRRQTRAQDGDENMGVLSDNHPRDTKESFDGSSSLTEKENDLERELKQANKFLAELYEQAEKLLPYWHKIELNCGDDIVDYSKILRRIGQKEVGDKLEKIGTKIDLWEFKTQNVINEILKDC